MNGYTQLELPRMIAPALIEPVKSKPHVSNNSGNDEWFTPVEYIDLVRSVLGTIDLDPASNAIANQWIRAERYYSISDDGLTKPWTGKVFMNPPYGRGLIDKFTGKLADHYIAGDITEAIVLVNNATETKWFQGIAELATGFCSPLGRIKYIAPDGLKKKTPLQGQTFLYLGQRYGVFRDVFKSIGTICRA